MEAKKQVFGGPYISRGRTLSLSKAVRAGDFIFLTGVVPRVGDEPMTTGSIEVQTRVVCETIKATLAEVGCGLDDARSRRPNAPVARPEKNSPKTLLKPAKSPRSLSHTMALTTNTRHHAGEKDEVSGTHGL